MRKTSNISDTICAVLAVLVLLASCRTAKAPQEPVLIIRDSVVYRDSLVKIYVPPVKMPGDTVKLVDTVPCPDTQWRGFAKSASGRTRLTAQIDKGKITIDCKTDSLVKIIDSLSAVIRSKDSYREKVKTVTVEVPRRYIPWWMYLVVAVCVLSLFIMLKR